MIIRTNENRLQETEMKVHQIKIDFHVTEQISRFVYVYIIEANSLYLVDSGVFGCEKQIIDYACFASDDYRQIMHERIDSVDARAVIVED